MSTEKGTTPHERPDPAHEAEQLANDHDRLDMADDVYAIGPTIYCGLCDQPLPLCMCFTDEDC